MSGSGSGSLISLLALGVPAALAVVAIASPRRALTATVVALGLASVFALAVACRSAAASSMLGVRLDVATCVMLVLITSLGAVVARFSITYLDGELGRERYLRWLLLTLGAVTVLVAASNLLVIAGAWTAASLCLHQLLTFYPDRPAALVAAHKKFLVSRFADGCLAVSLWLLHANVGSFELDRIAAWVAGQPELPTSMEVAAILLVVAVAARSAQLPFHGWITQVMEAPTPVSALLHAGVVNIGGFVLIRLAPWFERTSPAPLVLVIIGLVSTIGAVLVMTTRVSVKVALAWSTCAQMGFMLVQCGLGLWSLALLHLVAHSLYKGYAFLCAGSAVQDWKQKGAQRSQVPRRIGVAVAIGALVAVGATSVVHVIRSTSWTGPADVVLAILLALSLAPLLITRPTGMRGVLSLVLRIVGVVLLYLGWHEAANYVAPAPATPPTVVGWWLTGAGLVGLFVVRTLLHLAPEGRVARSLHPWLFSGLYLDEVFTRLAFRVWPPRRPGRSQPASARLRVVTRRPLEARS